MPNLHDSLHFVESYASDPNDIDRRERALFSDALRRDTPYNDEPPTDETADDDTLDLDSPYHALDACEWPSEEAWAEFACRKAERDERNRQAARPDGLSAADLAWLMAECQADEDAPDIHAMLTISETDYRQNGEIGGAR